MYVTTQVVGFTVQGFTVGRFSLLIFLEIVDETTNGGTGPSRLHIDIFEFVRQYRVFNAAPVPNPELLNLSSHAYIDFTRKDYPCLIVTTHVVKAEAV